MSSDSIILVNDPTQVGQINS